MLGRTNIVASYGEDPTQSKKTTIAYFMGNVFRSLTYISWVRMR
jgi:hypothetical protein